MAIIKTRTLGLAAAATVFGGIALSSLLGFWNTTSTKVPAAIQGGEFAGLPNPSDIRGSYTWAEVAKAFGMPLEPLLVAFGAAAPSGKVNGLEALYEGKLPPEVEIGTDSVRLFVALYLGLPHEPEPGTVLPATAIPPLEAAGRASPERLAEARERAFPAGLAPAAPADSLPPPPAPPLAAPEPSAPREPPAKSAALPSTASPETAALAELAGAGQTAAAAGGTASGAEGRAAEGSSDTAAALATGGGSTGSSGAAPAEHAAVAGSITGKTTFYDLRSWKADMAKVEEILGGIGPSSQSVRDYCAEKGLSFSEIKPRLQAIVP